MALTIKTFSPIIPTEPQYVKGSNYDARLFFEGDNTSELYYTIIQTEIKQNYNGYNTYNDVKYRVISNGKLNGYANGSVVDYKMDLSNYIRFKTAYKLNAETESEYPTIEEILRVTYILFEYNQSVMTTFASYFDSDGSGTYTMTAENLGIIYSNRHSVNLAFQISFFNQSGQSAGHYISPIIYKGCWYAINNAQAGESSPQIRIKEYAGGTLLKTYDTSASHLCNVHKLVKCNPNTTNVNVYLFDGETETGLQVLWTRSQMIGCTKAIAFSDSYGMLQVHNTTANQFISETTTRDTVDIGTRKLVKSSTTERKLHQHIGFDLDETLMYDLHRAEQFWTIDDTTGLATRWDNDATAFNSYNGLKKTERNVELIGTQYHKINNYSNQTQNFYD